MPLQLLATCSAPSSWHLHDEGHKLGQLAVLQMTALGQHGCVHLNAIDASSLGLGGAIGCGAAALSPWAQQVVPCGPHAAVGCSPIVVSGSKILVALQRMS